MVLGCDAEEQEQAAAGLVTESDAVTCGQNDTIYTNFTNFNENVHIKVHNGCHALPTDSIIVGSATVKVVDTLGQVVGRQQFRVSPRGTRRGTFSVPGKASIVIDCGFSDNRGTCPWSFSYSP